MNAQEIEQLLKYDDMLNRTIDIAVRAWFISSIYLLYKDYAISIGYVFFFWISASVAFLMYAKIAIDRILCKATIVYGANSKSYEWYKYWCSHFNQKRWVKHFETFTLVYAYTSTFIVSAFHYLRS